VPGWELELVDVHSLGDEGAVALIFDRDELVLGLSCRKPVLFAWLRGRPEGPWRRVDPGPPESWAWLALDPRDRTWVACTEAGQRLSSVDGGRWTPLEPAGPPAQTQLVGLRGATVWLAKDDLLWRSTDAGRTFVERPCPPSQATWGAVEGTGPLLASICGQELWVSTDDGEAWRQAELPGELELLRVAVDEAQGAVVVLGTDGAEAACLYSTDGGASWQRWGHGLGEMGHSLLIDRWGRWWCSLSPAQPGAAALFTSPALGAPWAPCADAICDQLFADPTGPDTVWGCSLGTVLRVRRRVQ
jgi:hypothetical protein